MRRFSYRSFVIAALALAALALFPWMVSEAWLNFSLVAAALWLALAVAGVIAYGWRVAWLVPLGLIVLFIPAFWGLIAFACSTQPCDF